MNQKKNKIPAISTDEMREVDRLMIEEFGIELEMMMENAGRNLALLCSKILAKSIEGKKILVAVGKGNNGGGGLAAARYLHNWGAEIEVLIEGKDLIGVPRAQLSIVEKLDIEVTCEESAILSLRDSAADLIIDSLIGYGLNGNPRGWTAEMIDSINNSTSIPVLSLDAPSGLDTTSGTVADPCVKATVTMTLALPKTGLFSKEGRNVVGKLVLADIGVPSELYRMMGIEAGSIFSKDVIIDLS